MKYLKLKQELIYWRLNGKWYVANIISKIVKILVVGSPPYKTKAYGPRAFLSCAPVMLNASVMN